MHTKMVYNFISLVLTKLQSANMTMYFNRRHCLLAEIMEIWKESDFIYADDSDVIYHGYGSEWHNPEEDVDLVFFERYWNGDVTAGKLVKIKLFYMTGLLTCSKKFKMPIFKRYLKFLVGSY